jgi:hypothetical protein
MTILYSFTFNHISFAVELRQKFLITLFHPVIPSHLALHLDSISITFILLFILNRLLTII